MPQLSIAPLFRQLADFYKDASAQPSLPSELTEVSSQVSTMFAALGERFNLFDLLVSSILLHVPSLITGLEAIPGTKIIELSEPLFVLGLVLLLALLSIFIGVLYIGQLARNLPIGEGALSFTQKELLQRTFYQWLRVLVFVLLVVLVFFAVYIPASIGMTLLLLISPTLGSFAWMIVSGIAMVAVFYLYFATIAMVMDDLSIRQAVMRSFGLVRESFWSTLGFIMLVNIISLGFILLLHPLAMRPPAGTLFAILANAYIGTGLVLGLLVFYRTRHLKLNDLTVG